MEFTLPCDVKKGPRSPPRTHQESRYNLSTGGKRTASQRVVRPVHFPLHGRQGPARTLDYFDSALLLYLLGEDSFYVIPSLVGLGSCSQKCILAFFFDDRNRIGLSAATMKLTRRNELLFPVD